MNPCSLTGSCSAHSKCSRAAVANVARIHRQNTANPAGDTCTRRGEAPTMIQTARVRAPAPAPAPHQRATIEVHANDDHPQELHVLCARHSDRITQPAH